MEPVTTCYLEMFSPDEGKAESDAQGLVLTECRVKQHQLNRVLYQLVGKPWCRAGTLVWSGDMWRDYAGSDNLRTRVAWHGGARAGYDELLRQSDDVAIRFLGLARILPG